MKKILLIMISCFAIVQPKPAPQVTNRRSSEPYISGDSFRAIADHVYDETDRSLRSSEVKQNQIIFVKTDYLQDFFAHIHPKIQSKYILITHNSDYGAPGSFERYLNEEKIIAWFGQNPTIQATEKFIPIPIGLANQCWPHGNIATFAAVSKKIVSVSKNIVLGINFRPGTNDVARNYPYRFFSSQSFCKHIFDDNLSNYLYKMAQAKCILSPRGNGLDCHRTWEAFLMGSIPVLLHSELDPLFVGLPVVLVDKWNEITENFLNECYEKIKTESYNLSKIYFQYWKDLIESYR